MDRIKYWLPLLVILFAVSVFCITLQVDKPGDKFMMLILGGMGILPFYLFAFFQTILLSLNNISNKRRFIYPAVLGLSLLGVFFSYLFFSNPGGYDMKLERFLVQIPFLLISFKTLHYWYKEWKESW